MTDLVHVTAQSHTFAIVGEASSLAEQIARTDFVPDALKGRPDAVMACVLKGHELGMGPMQSLGSINVIKGRPSLSAEGMRALVLAAGHDITVKEMTPTRCKLAGRRSNSDQWTEITFTMDDAKRAKLGGNNWQSYPADMLLARATSRLCRAVFADVIGGLLSVEEAEDIDAPAVTSTTTRKAPARKRTTPAAETPFPDPEPTPEQPPLPHELDDDVVDAEIIDDDGPQMVTRAQLDKLMVEFDLAKMTERPERLAYCIDFVKRPLESSKELTKSEASRIIDELVTTREASEREASA